MIGRVDAGKLGGLDARKLGGLDARKLGGLDAGKFGGLDARKLGGLDAGKVGNDMPFPGSNSFVIQMEKFNIQFFRLIRVPWLKPLFPLDPRCGLMYLRILLNWQLKRATFDHHPVFPAKARIQCYRGFFWIPALRFAAAGMTK
jgi:hypothetical protein